MDRHLIICDNLAPFSTSSSARILAGELSNDSHVSFLSLDANSKNSNERLRLPCEHLSLSLGERWDLSLALRLRSIVRKFQPSSIHAFCEHPQRLLNLLTASPTQNVTVYIANRTSRTALRARMFNRFAFGKKLRYSVTCQELAQDLICSGIAADSITIRCFELPEHLRPNIAPIANHRSKLVRAVTGADHGAKLVSIVAPLTPRTCLKDLIWAGELLKAIRDDVHFAVIGGLDREFSQHPRELNTFIQKTYLAQHVHFLDWTDDAPAIIAASDCYCETSDWIPDSSALRFAMHAGVPAAIVDSSFNRRNFRDEHDCLVFAAHAKNEIGRKLRRLLDDRECAAALAEHARCTTGQPHRQLLVA